MVSRSIPEMEQAIGALRSEGESLAQFLANLSVQDWERDSACDAWKVGDVVAHLAQGGAGTAAALARGKQGISDPPEGARFLDAGERASEMTADRAISFRSGMDGADLLAALQEGHNKVCAAAESLAPEDWGKPSFHRRGVIPIHENVTRRIQELAIHGWDIRSAFDPASEMSDGAAALIVNVAHRWLNACFLPLTGGANARFRFQVSGPVVMTEDVVLEGDGFRIEPAGASAPDATFVANASAYVLLIYGRLDISSGSTPVQLEIDGPLEKALLFTESFRGY